MIEHEEGVASQKKDTSAAAEGRRFGTHHEGCHSMVVELVYVTFALCSQHFMETSCMAVPRIRPDRPVHDQLDQSFLLLSVSPGFSALIVTLTRPAVGLRTPKFRNRRGREVL